MIRPKANVCSLTIAAAAGLQSSLLACTEEPKVEVYCTVDLSHPPLHAPLSHYFYMAYLTM
ncbi:hypothetical protein K431DRAFT_282693 [Polychaeton citri CBS 116435]|uniref:Uncharacterized protein n=1 Tax=Polychaeton citri CBS 116435 TaxID=1314669 RepID=A0A9P4UR66_9PEZI|nr:hypothetical protein K431DRAFT_282693 [Polychaeton citri CBS 116435]